MTAFFIPIGAPIAIAGLTDFFINFIFTIYYSIGIYCNNKNYKDIKNRLNQSWAVLQVHGYLFGISSTGILSKKYLK